MLYESLHAQTSPFRQIISVQQLSHLEHCQTAEQIVIAHACAPLDTLVEQMTLTYIG